MRTYSGRVSVQCGLPFKLPTFEHRYTAHQALGPGVRENVVINTCGFWAAFYTLGLTMRVPLLSVSPFSAWVKKVLYEYQREYTSGGLTRETYWHYMEGLPDPAGLRDDPLLSEKPLVCSRLDACSIS